MGRLKPLWPFDGPVTVNSMQRGGNERDREREETESRLGRDKDRWQQMLRHYQLHHINDKGILTLRPYLVLKGLRFYHWCSSDHIIYA